MPRTNNSKARKAERRASAEARQAAYDALTDAERIDKLVASGISLDNAGEMRRLRKRSGI